MAVDFRPKIGGSGAVKSSHERDYSTQSTAQWGKIHFEVLFQIWYSCDKITKTWIPFPDKIETAFSQILDIRVDDLTNLVSRSKTKQIRNWLSIHN